MATELPKVYNSKETEERIYRQWEESGFFNPDNLPLRLVRQAHSKQARGKPDREPYVIIMPPPNVTGVLHAGHALFVTLQDIFIRTARMQGRKTLWLPGTDHAAIATQAKVEKNLYEKKKKTRHDIGREAFLQRVQEFAHESQNTILQQIRAMGASCDWSRLAYTLDDTRAEAVNEAFKRMYNLGLIYRGKRIVNWDPKLQTTVSDDEVDWKEETTPFYYLKYGPFVIGTARPETKFGDKYVVVHPDDPRYAHYDDGQTLDVEWINGTVTATVIKDTAIDMEFGTGAMTITPAHDATDFDIAQRHGLDIEQVIDERGILLPIAGDLSGEHIKKARPKIVEILDAKGLVERIDETYLHRIATNSRGGGLIEPQVKEQWFIAVNKPFVLQESHMEGVESGQEVTLKQLMRHVVETGQISIVPERFAKTYYHWIDNLRDWNISRQIWFGHRIPAWYSKSTAKIHVGTEPQDGKWEQDPDTLDTWFSSGLWTFSTLGWPHDTDDLRTFHPTTVLETAYEILFFWVARMILMTTALTGHIPFKTVYLHGLVRDERREKLSKSKGDSANPVDFIEKFGADALRFALIFNTSPGMDSVLSEEKIKGMKHFANKLWNISRFVLMGIEAEHTVPDTMPAAKTDADRIILDALTHTIEDVGTHLAAYRVHEAAQSIYQFTWHAFADIYLEASKPQLAGEKTKESTQNILLFVLATILKLLHPFMPFITEALWSKIPGTDEKLLMIQSWPHNPHS